MKGMKSMLGQDVKVGMYTVNVKEKIGEGGYAWVFLAEDMQRNQYALKYVRVAEKSRFRQFAKEAQFLQSIPEHKNIVKLFAADANEHDNTIKFLFEYAPVTAISILKERNMTNKEIIVFFHAVCDAVAFLHSQKPPIIHRDVKPENILVSQEGIPILCDFGSATKTIYNPTVDNIPIIQADIDENTTQSYRSPEMIDLYSQNPIGPPADVWALGCTLFKLITKDDLYKPEDRLAILQGRITIPPGCDPAFEQTIRACLQVDQTKRPSAAQIAASYLKARGDQDRIQVAPRQADSAASSQQSSNFSIFGFVKEAYRSITTSGIEQVIVKATFGNNKPPKSKHVRNIILSSIKDPSMTRSITNYLLSGRPWQSDPRIAAKVLYMVLMIAQYQRDLSAFVPITVKTDNIVNRYSNSKLGESYRGSLVAIAQLGAVIRVKMMLHAAHPEIEANFAINGSADSHLSEDLKRYILSVCQAGSAMLDGMGSIDSFVTEVLMLPVINEIGHVGALLRTIDPTCQEIVTARQVMGRAICTDYLSSSVTANIDTPPRRRF
jgi:AP2-associated kinase